MYIFIKNSYYVLQLLSELTYDYLILYKVFIFYENREINKTSVQLFAYTLRTKN